VEAYAIEAKAKTVIINSTVAVGTTESLNKKLSANVVHSPVRGVHPNLAGGLIVFDKQIGYDGDKSVAEDVAKFFRKIGITNTKLVPKSRNTELAKLVSTTTYGVQIAWATEVKRLCDEYKCDYDEVYTDSNKIYNTGYESLGKPQFKKPLLYPNTGGFSGHCVWENHLLISLTDLWNGVFNKIGKKK